jgi:uncharacterized membrane protein HdeD (DUF308 family)
MLRDLGKHWWVFLLRGVLAILFGIICFAMPGMALTVLVALFAAFALVDGVFTIIGAIKHREEVKHWWAYLLEGLLGVGIGVATWFWPGVTALALLYLIAFWAIATGIFEIVAAWKLREEIEGEWALGLAGVLSVVFGVLLIARPGAGALAVIWLIGVYAILFGILLIIVGFKVKGVRGTIEDVRDKVEDAVEAIRDE